MEDCGYQRWHCELKIDGMHPQNAPLSAIFFLRFWDNGGISGAKERNRDDENLMFNRLSRSTSGVKNAGDVFGDWSSSEISFTLVTRHQPCKWEFQGKWEETLKSVSEGRFKVTQDNFRMDTTVGTFKLHIDKKTSFKAGENDVKRTNVFIENLTKYVKNSSEDKHFYDFKIIAEDGKEVKCHKIILASQTEYFGALFRQENPDFVKLDFSENIIRGCIGYLYSEDIDVNGDNVQDVIVFANYVMITEVVKVCEAFIRNNIDTTNCIDVFKLGDFLGNSVIIEEASNLICRNFQTVFSSKDDLKNLPAHLFKLLLESDKLILFSEVHTILPGKEREEMLENFIKEYSDLNQLNEDSRKDFDGLLRKSGSFRELAHLKNWVVPEKMGTAGDRPRTERKFNLQKNTWLRKISLGTIEWDGRTVIGGISLKWADGTIDTVGTIGEDGNRICEMEVPDGEHISFVIGNSGWYVDSLTFITSSGRKLGSCKY